MTDIEKEKILQWIHEILVRLGNIQRVIGQMEIEK
jgi:hypothetical protein